MGERIQAVREDIAILHEMLGELRELRGRSTELLALTRGNLNEVLWAGTATPDVSGSWRHTVQVPFASVGFADPNGLGLTIAAGEPGASGPGVFRFSANWAGCVPLVGTQLVVSPGAAGAFVIVLFNKPQPFWAAS